MTTRMHARPVAPVRRSRLSLDPYLVEGTTWTREELLRARGAIDRRDARRAAPVRRPTAA